MPPNTYVAAGIVTYRSGNAAVLEGIAAPPWSCTHNEACRLCAGLSMVDSLRLPVQNNSIAGVFGGPLMAWEGVGAGSPIS